MQDHCYKRIILIGAGRAGRALTRLWHNLPDYRIVAVHGHNVQAREFARELACAEFDYYQGLPAAELIIIATPDDGIAEVAAGLAQHALTGYSVLHLSGAMDLACLAPCAAQGAQVASVHPVRSFTAQALRIEEFANTPCAVQCAAQTKEQIHELFSAIGGACFDLNITDKRLYHAAAVIASNGQFVLADAAIKLWQSQGVEADMARLLFQQLSSQTIANIASQGVKESLTGPVSRGDRDLLAQQNQALDSFNKDYKALYNELNEWLEKLTR